MSPQLHLVTQILLACWAGEIVKNGLRVAKVRLVTVLAKRLDELLDMPLAEF